MTNEELDALETRAMIVDPLLEVDYDTQLDVERDPYGAREAIETALYLIRDQATAITTLRAQLAEARAEFAMARTDADELRMSLRRAEAALAAQIEVDAGIVTAMKGNGWDENPAVHPYDKGYIAACDAAISRIRAQPQDRTALDHYREKALRDAPDAR